jgi:hypothetical protein
MLCPTGLTVALVADPEAAPPGPHRRAAPASGESLSCDVLDERAWQLQRAADLDVRCAASLDLPFCTSIGEVGHLTIYASDPDAFDDVQAVLDAAGVSGATPIANHDLPMRGLEEARRGPDALKEHDTIEIAVGYVMGTLGITPDEARMILWLGAVRRGVDLASHARSVLRFDR